jgi:hypothetical protein
MLASRIATWILWALATSVTVILVPVAYRAAHHVYHEVGEVHSLSTFTKAALFLGQRLWLLSGSLGVISAAFIVLLPATGRLAVAFQLLIFLAVCSLMAQGMLEPFELMCSHPEGLTS